MNAQDLYKTFIRDRLAPALRSRGFKGSGQKFRLPVGGTWALLGLQKSKYSDSSSVSFTINLTAVSESAWADARARFPFYPAQPAPNTFYGDFAWQKRIGLLTEENEDRWWCIDGTTNQEALLTEVVGVIDATALPALKQEVEGLTKRERGDSPQAAEQEGES